MAGAALRGCGGAKSAASGCELPPLKLVIQFVTPVPSMRPMLP
jgi:hypothetical protein